MRFKIKNTYYPFFLPGVCIAIMAVTLIVCLLVMPNEIAACRAMIIFILAVIGFFLTMPK